MHRPFFRSLSERYFCKSLSIGNVLQLLEMLGQCEQLSMHFKLRGVCP